MKAGNLPLVAHLSFCMRQRSIRALPFHFRFLPFDASVPATGGAFLEPMFVYPGRKAPAVGASEHKEETMKLITRFELASRGTSELYALRRSVFNALAGSKPSTAERRTALASLENLDAEIRSRPPAP